MSTSKLSVCKKYGKSHTLILSLSLVSRLFVNNGAKTGGGVGYYIKNDIKYKILTHLSPFTEIKFESLSIEITLNNKKSIHTM
jgi:hypothetical protein